MPSDYSLPATMSSPGGVARCVKPILPAPSMIMTSVRNHMQFDCQPFLQSIDAVPRTQFPLINGQFEFLHGPARFISHCIVLTAHHPTIALRPKVEGNERNNNARGNSNRAPKPMPKI
uniref:Uncharacterized protein n=1 Tax=Anopheles minimus TaxID=112268 RepID=A0A182VXR0_9DIPT